MAFSARLGLSWPGMDAFPAFFPLAGRTIVIAGTGEAAEVKVRLFEGSPAEVQKNPAVIAAYLGGELS